MITLALQEAIYGWLKANQGWHDRYAIAAAVGASEYDVHAALFPLVATYMVNEHWNYNRMEYRCAYPTTTN